MRILFMGTPDFALPTLRALCESGHDIVGVVTKIDMPRGRGHHMMPTPIKVYAMEQGIPVYQPNTLKGDEFASTLAELDPEMIVVVAFGKILPRNVLDYPKYGCINVHGSLLPEYRGAAPMQRAIMDGKRETGVTTMLMDVASATAGNTKIRSSEFLSAGKVSPSRMRKVPPACTVTLPVRRAWLPSSKVPPVTVTLAVASA